MPTHEIEQRLMTQGVRYTRGRKAVVAALQSGDGPRSAAELHDECGPDVPVSSLYRSLTVLEQAGVVVPHFGKGVTRYELAEWITGHHHHLVCIDCGSVEDIDIRSPNEAEVTRLVDEISRTASFTPTAHVLEIEGHCARCSR